MPPVTRKTAGQRAVLAHHISTDLRSRSQAGSHNVGRQVRFDVDGDEFFIDLLLFHVEQLRYVVIEIKARKFQPADAGQLGSYVAMVDDQRRRPGHRPTVGILLCADRNEQVVRYALGSAGAPMAVSTYTYDTLPESERADLPPAEALTAAITPPQARHEPDSADPGQ